MPPARVESMISFMMRCAQSLLFLLSATSPKLQPSTADIPLNAEFTRSFDHLTPMKLSSTSTLPIMDSIRTISLKCLSSCAFLLSAPSAKTKASGSDVSSLTPGAVICAPQPIAQPYVLSSPIISDTLCSGRPFCIVQITPSSAKKFVSIFTTSLLLSCFVIRKIMSYFSFISSGSIALTFTLKFAVPVMVAPCSFNAATCALFLLTRSISSPLFATYAPSTVPSEPAP